MMNLLINQFLFINFKINLISLINYLRIQINLFNLIAYDIVTFLISFINLNLMIIHLIIYNNYLKIFINNINLRFEILKLILFIFINFNLPSLLIKIRVYYLLSIVIINLLLILLNYSIYELNFITFNLVSFFNLESYSNLESYFYLSNNPLDDNFNYVMPTNQNGNSNHNDFNFSSSSNNNLNPSNNPNPLGSDSNAIVLINGNQEIENNNNLVYNTYYDSDNTSDYNSSSSNESLQSRLLVNNDNTGNESSQVRTRLLFRASSPVTIFNEVSYDPQFDDLEFNTKVLYPYGHIWFDRMVQFHINNYSVGSLMEIISNTSYTDNLYWNTESINEAIEYIRNKINQ
uniref:Uncharacterized protein n=1 Tax=Hygrophorus russula TaxID=264141 RepID=A0A346LZM3_9AGAR|nr:hypothetical protein [Hygrophorus russula]AXQ02218.1 hypothetical protein [Hygrophorus russula]